jgi:hypothetical protein
VARLGSPNDSVLLGATSAAVAVTSAGHFIVPGGAGQVVVFDRSGRFVRSIGRRGPGPGEFRSINDVRVTPGDSVIVADARKLELFGPDFQYVRQLRIVSPGSFAQTLLLPNGGIIRQTRPERLVVMRPDGTVQDSVTLPVVPAAPGCRGCNVRWLAASSTTGRFWSSISNRYEIQQLDATGVVHQALTRRPSWYAPWDSIPRGSPTRPAAPVSSLYGIREDAAGMLWSLASVPDVRWREVKEGGIASVEKWNTRTDGILSVIDPQAGVVLAERRLPGSVGFVHQSDNMIFLQEEDPADGYVTIQVLRVQLKRP